MKVGYGFIAVIMGLAVYGVSALGERAGLGLSIAAAAQGQWGQQAEDTFRLGQGLGSRLMTQEEWREHQQRMQSMTAAERQRYREEWHQKMVERARERGIATPETPGPQRGYGPRQGYGIGGGMGPRGGMGSGGMGPGGGMGLGGGMGRGGRR